MLLEGLAVVRLADIIPEIQQYIIANLALSSGFGWVDWDKLVFPGKLKIDYLRLYQAKGKENVGCDREFPRLVRIYVGAHVCQLPYSQRLPH